MAHNRRYLPQTQTVLECGAEGLPDKFTNEQREAILKLTVRQRIFVQQYLLHLDPEAAAREARFDPWQGQTFADVGNNLLQKPYILRAVRLLVHPTAVHVDKSMIVDELLSIGFEGMSKLNPAASKVSALKAAATLSGYDPKTGKFEEEDNEDELIPISGIVINAVPSNCYIDHDPLEKSALPETKATKPNSEAVSSKPEPVPEPATATPAPESMSIPISVTSVALKPASETPEAWG